MSSMKPGAFAILDCLGFKGSWARDEADPQEIINSLKESQRLAKESASSSWLDKLLQGNVKTSVAYLSDTVVIAIQTKDDTPHFPGLSGALVLTATLLSIYIANTLLKGKHPFCVRGCISYGEYIFDSDGPYYVGPVVDEVASFSHEGDGAFIWTTPRAASLIPEFRNWLRTTTTQWLARQDEQFLIGVAEGFIEPRLQRICNVPELQNFAKLSAKRQAQYGRVIARLTENLRTHQLITFAMPLKRGSPLEVGVANLYYPYRSVEPDPLPPLIRKAFGTSSNFDVLVKQENTLRYLREARQETAKEITMLLAGFRKIELEELGGQIFTDDQLTELLW